MRVAVFINNSTPEGGGSYTFESQLIGTLLELCTESRHTFIGYISDREVPNYLSNIPIRIVSLDLTLSQKITRQLLLIVKALFDKIRHPRSKFAIKNWRDRHVLNLLEANRIDLTLSLTPNTPTLEYPYITTVWDLQHKLQSYFPEVSKNGEWDCREEYHLKMLNRAAAIITGTETGKAEIERFYQIPAERIKVIPMFAPQLRSNPDGIVGVGVGEASRSRSVSERREASRSRWRSRSVPKESLCLSRSVSERREAAAGRENRDVITKYQLPDRYLFYPAQFWPHKNHVGLLLALKCLQEKYNLEVPLVLVGADKGNEPYIKAMVKKLDLSARVYFLGFVPLQDMAALYRNAFAMTFVTFFGPDNLPPLEAMALGCPTIASNVSGAQEQLGDAALLVDPKQPEEIAAAIHALFTDATLRQNKIELGLKRAYRWNSKDYIREIFTMLDDFEAIRRCWQ
ncbi:glycosyltransferase family 1 protein [Chamaesiphon sp. VAR_48_metabat_403]|uniref:glycosyltransferase family 4 protein n=1 Tax=Chamaesiphon sp. VAR_48_metabat_403 TaxID=2964700 RepID=UPI00286D9161|nr:glycosyltransferase family 1 protein [Chamaesiphon sp. VAR_48_metabat_403]